MAEVGLRCHIAASDLGRVGPKPPRKASIRPSVRVIIDAVSGFSSVSCRETWRIPVPRIRDRLHRIEPSLSKQPPRGQTGRIEPRSPDGRPGGTDSQRLERLSLRPLVHSGRSAPCTLAGSSRLRHGSCGTGRSLTKRRSALRSSQGWPLPSQRPKSFPATDHLGRTASSFSPASGIRPVCNRQAVGGVRHSSTPSKNDLRHGCRHGSATEGSVHARQGHSGNGSRGQCGRGPGSAEVP